MISIDQARRIARRFAASSPALAPVVDSVGNAPELTALQWKLASREALKIIGGGCGAFDATNLRLLAFYTRYRAAIKARWNA